MLRWHQSAAAVQVFSYYMSGKNGFVLIKQPIIAQLVAVAGLRHVCDVHGNNLR
jgi:hypothetical protein